MDSLTGIDLNKIKAIKSTIAMFRNFSVDNLIENAVVLFWESHTDNTTDKERIHATADLIQKTFDISKCEAYEVRTGYLSRYNFLKVEVPEATERDWDEAINLGMESEDTWVKRCEPCLPGFKLQEWTESISAEYNPYYEQCKALLQKHIVENKEFEQSFWKGIDSYAERHGANKINGSYYMLEEMSWIFSLMLTYWDKPIYLIHVGNDNPGIKDMFKIFPNLSKSVKWLSPKCIDNVEFINLADFLMYYRCNNYAGCSYMVEHPEIMDKLRNGEMHGQRKIN